MVHYVCSNCQKNFGNKKDHLLRHLNNKRGCSNILRLLQVPEEKILHRQGGVYSIWYLYDKVLYPNECRLKIGHSRDLKSRFSSYNTQFSDTEQLVENNLKFLLHSGVYAFSGTRILESIVHHHFREYRINKKKEFFSFPREFNLDDYFQSLDHSLKTKNITDVQVYHRLQDVPRTQFPTGYRDLLPEEEDDKDTGRLIETTIKPRDYQVEIIEMVVNHYDKCKKGGLFLPPGYGKTYITTLALLRMGITRGLIMTHRLSIVREWEKCFKLAGFEYKIVNSEHLYDLKKYKQKNIFIITTYQTFSEKMDSFAKTYPMVIFDEAHVLAGQVYSTCRQVGGKHLYLTATPVSKVVDINEEKETIYDCTKFSRNTIKQVSLNDAIEQGCLADYKILTHNKPAQTNCVEHVEDLINIYGRKKILVFYNTRAEAKEAFGFLQESKWDAWYIDGETKDREDIFEQFEQAEVGIIVNIGVLAEGVSLPCVDAVLLMGIRNSERSIIQILGRSLRLYKDKQCSIMCIPEDAQDTLETALSALVFDTVGREKILSKLMTHTDDIGLCQQIVQNVDKKLKWYEICRGDISGMVQYKMEILMAIIKETGQLVAQKYEQDGIKLGSFQNNLLCAISGINNYFKKYLNKWCQTYPDQFKLLDERAKNAQETRASRTLSYTEKIILLMAVIAETGQLVAYKYEQDGIKLGSFQDKLLGAISGANNRFKKHLKEWRQTYSDQFKLLDERAKSAQEIRAFRTVPFTKKIILLMTVIDQTGQLVVAKYEQDGIKLGHFQHTLLGAISGRTNHFKKYLPKWRKTYPEQFKLLDERIASRSS